MDDNRLAQGRIEPVAVQRQIDIVEHVSLAPDADGAVAAGQIAHLAAQRRLPTTLLAVEPVVVGIGQLDECGVPTVAGSGAARLLELDGGVKADRIDVDGPVVARCHLPVRLARILEPHLNDGICGAAIVVDHLAEAQVAPGKAERMVKGGNGRHLSGLVRVPAPAHRAAGPPRPLHMLVDDDGSADNGVGPKHGQIGVVVYLLHRLPAVQEAVLPAQVAGLELVGCAGGRAVGRVPLPRVEVAAYRVPTAGKLQLRLDRDLVDMIGAGLPFESLQLHEGVGGAELRLLDELQAAADGGGGTVAVPLPRHALEKENTR